MIFPVIVELSMEWDQILDVQKTKTIFWSDRWYIHANGGDIFQIIIFDLISSIFKCWFRFSFATSMLLVILRSLKWLSNKVIAYRFMVVEVILFRWLYLISLIVFSNVGPGSNFATSILLFILSGSKLSSKDVVILEIRKCDGTLTDIRAH